MIGKILFVVFIIAMLVLVQGVKQGNEIDAIAKQKYMDEYKPIKEMSVDLLTKGEVGGGYLLIMGSVYGHIDTSRYITLIYGQNENGEMVYKPIILPLEQVEFVTIGKGKEPYIKPTKVNKEEKCYGGFSNCEWVYTMYKTKLYLPDGWQILTSQQVKS